jgi:hypothetical protein
MIRFLSNLLKCPFPAILFSLSVSYKHRARHPRIISSLDNRNSRGKPGLVMKELSTLFTLEYFIKMWLTDWLVFMLDQKWHDRKWLEVTWPEEALYGSMFCACVTGSCPISDLVGSFWQEVTKSRDRTRPCPEEGPTRSDMAQPPVAHAQNILPDRTRDWHHFRSRS